MPKYWRAGSSVTIEPTGHEIEELTADRFERVAHAEGIDLGPRSRRDGDGLRVDFVFERAEPPIALEVTSIVDTSLLQVSGFLLKMGEALTALARTQGLGFWSIAVREGWKDKALASAIAQFLEAERSRVPPALFAAPALNLDAVPLPEELVRLGLLSALKQHGEPGVHVLPQVSAEGPAAIAGLSDALVACIVDKEPVLCEARPRETHLAVLVEDARFPADPRALPPPQPTDAVDVLWVFLSDFLEPRYGPRIWRVRRGMTQWDLFGAGRW
jgi:hypothetical protein